MLVDIGIDYAPYAPSERQALEALGFQFEPPTPYGAAYPVCVPTRYGGRLPPAPIVYDLDLAHLFDLLGQVGLPCVIRWRAELQRWHLWFRYED
jgi:hypothetical protein